MDRDARGSLKRHSEAPPEITLAVSSAVVSRSKQRVTTVPTARHMCNVLSFRKLALCSTYTVFQNNLSTIKMFDARPNTYFCCKHTFDLAHATHDIVNILKK